MTDGTQDEPLSPEAQQLLAEQAAQLPAAQPSPAADQAATAAQMTDRGPVLPAESEIDAFMTQMREQFASMSAELNALKAQQAAALQAGGGPMVTRYAQGAADKVAALIAAHPDAPRDHFAPLADAAGKLADAAGALVKSGGDSGKLESAAAAVGRFLERTHWKAWGKHIDFSALADDVETAVEEGIKLAA